MLIDKNQTYVGIVEENIDPRKIGRCRVRVIDIFDDIPVEDIPWASPWKDLNGNSFNVPDKGKVVTVVFDSGNIYKPEYIYAEHFNINLENKLKNLSDEDYLSMKGIFFDQSTQIYRNKSEGLKIDHEYTNLNLDKNGNILLNLRDNKSVITLGSRDADEEAILGTTFMQWFDLFIQNLEVGAYIDGNGSQVISNPSFMACLAQYEELRSDFVSEHVRIAKNKKIIKQNRQYINQFGDNWKSSKFENTLTTISPPDYTPSSKYWSPTTGQEEDYQPLESSLTDNVADYNPGDFRSSVEYDIPTTSLDKSKFQNGKLPESILQFSRWANGEKKGKWISTNLKGKTNAKLTSEAAAAFDSLFNLYESVDFPGKSKIIITDGYRTYQEQVHMKDKYGSFAATPGTSNHGWGLAMDISGMGNPFKTIKGKTPDRESVFRGPVYQWFFENSWQFGIYNPESLRDGSRTDEYWHWEFHGNKGKPTLKFEQYGRIFTKKDYLVLRRNGVSSPSDSEFKTYFDKFPDRNK